MKREVLNNSLGSPYIFAYPNLTVVQEQEIVSAMFEQLLIFDKIILSTSRVNYALFFLLKRFGLYTVEKMLDSGYLKFMLWTPLIVTGVGKEREDKTMDESVIYGQSPIVAGSLSKEDLDPERNIMAALSRFDILPSKRKMLTKAIRKHYIIPDGMLFSKDSANLVIDAYKNNNLATLGLPFEKEPDQLDIEERGKLLDLSHKVIETAILSKFELKSYENYETFEICKHNLANIGKAYKVAENSSTVFKLENLPHLKELFNKEKLDFDSVFRIRHLSNAKYYRKWINEIGENSNAEEIAREYLNEIKGNNNFFEKTEGKLVKNLLSFGVNSALGAAIAGPVGVGVGFFIGLLEDLWLDNILKGKNPSMFIDDVKNEILEKN